MNKNFRHFWKSYNEFSRSDRNAIIILCVLILLSVIAIIIVRNIQPKSKYNYSEYEQLLDSLIVRKENRNDGKSLFMFDPNSIKAEMLDSLDLPDNIKRNILNYRKAGGRFTNQSQVRKIYGMNDSIFAVIENYLVFSEKSDSIGSHHIKVEKSITGFFDPNNADYNQLIEFGFNSFQANNLINYRTKAGFFKSRNDLLKIYGIDTAFFKSIENHIQINIVEEATKLSSNPVLVYVELNSADSTDLVQLTGIGPAYANRIIKYRNLLGGFYSKAQILEVYNFPVETFQKIENSISADTLLIKKIRVNFAEFHELIRHPYFNKKQVEAVLNFRNRNGSFQSILQLKSNGLIDPETFLKLKPYLTCR